MYLYLAFLSLASNSCLYLVRHADDDILCSKMGNIEICPLLSAIGRGVFFDSESLVKVRRGSKFSALSILLCPCKQFKQQF